MGLALAGGLALTPALGMPIGPDFATAGSKIATRVAYVATTVRAPVRATTVRRTPTKTVIKKTTVRPSGKVVKKKTVVR
jgi:hypothetical protein